MGTGLVGTVTSYLDTQSAIWLCEARVAHFSPQAKKHIARSALLISPMVLLEFQYLFEIGKTLVNARDLERKLQTDLGVTVCRLDFATVATVALDENWTRDPFDRMIAANAKANNFSYLITSDAKIRRHYAKAIW
jgi:PIN domain nuclease of toxin-antitoxin system